MLNLDHRAWVEVDLGAIAHNVTAMKSLLPPSTQIMAIAKADAYGHGAVDVARTALSAGAKRLGVATIPEGVQLRQAGVTAPIAILGATNTLAELREMVEYRLQPTIGHGDQLRQLAEFLTALGQRLGIHGAIDTGMGRLGVHWTEGVAFARACLLCPVVQVCSFYSHLATADEPDPTLCHQQRQRFEAVCRALQQSGWVLPPLHLANTAALLRDRTCDYDWVRPGLGIYGLYPAPHLRDRLTLRPAMTVKARITQIKTLPAGSGISYGHRYHTDSERAIAVVGIGYADGIPRGLSNRIAVAVGGGLAPQVGTITMDQCMIDVTELPRVRVGDVVTVLGDHPGGSAQEWAEILGTISWEILCGFKHRLPRLNLLARAIAPAAAAHLPK